MCDSVGYCQIWIICCLNIEILITSENTKKIKEIKAVMYNK